MVNLLFREKDTFWDIHVGVAIFIGLNLVNVENDVVNLKVNKSILVVNKKV